MRAFVEAVYRKPFTNPHGPVVCLVEPESAWPEDRKRSALALDD